MLETLSPLNITSFGNTSSIKSSLLYTRKENALLFRASQTCSKNFLATLSHVIHCHFHFLVLPQSEIYYFSRQYFNTSAAIDDEQIWNNRSIIVENRFVSNPGDDYDPDDEKNDHDESNRACMKPTLSHQEMKPTNKKKSRFWTLATP